MRKTDRLIVIECSAEQPVAKQGDGCIIRVGDRSSIFNSGLTYFLSEQAAALAKVDPTFKCQRALMPGGTCEATVYDVYGFTAASVCVALGNYHNMNRAAGRLAREHVHIDDWSNMRKLFIHLARAAHTFRPGHAALKAKLAKRFEKLRTALGD